MHLYMDSVSDGEIEPEETVTRISEGTLCDHFEEAGSECTDDEDIDQPCWTFLSDDLGIDCSRMCLSEFFTYLEDHPSVLSSNDRDEIFAVIREEMDDVSKGLRINYADLYS